MGRSLAMTVVSEFGDETFIIAALMAMRHERTHVLTGALGALWTMTALSATLGWLVPQLLSPKLTHALATVLFFVFAAKLAVVGYQSDDNEFEEELAEVKKQLRLSQGRSSTKRESKRRSSRTSSKEQPEDEPGVAQVHDGDSSGEGSGEEDKSKRSSKRATAKRQSRSESKRTSAAQKSKVSEMVRRLDFPEALKPMKSSVLRQVAELERLAASIQLAPIISQVFMLVFLAEWGDRSQIATVTLAADNNPFGVVLGAMLGHAICTTLAVMIGNHLAQYVSQKLLAYVGAVIFLAFGLANVLSAVLASR